MTAPRRGRSPDYRERVARPAGDYASPAASAAQDVLLARLRTEKGKHYRTVCQAIEDGHLTDMDWCEELDRQREIFGGTHHKDPEAKTAHRQEYRQKWWVENKGRYT